MIKKLFEHLPTSIFFSYLFYEQTNHLLLSLIPLFMGWLIDVDHLFDYYFYISHKKKNFSIKNFFSGSYFKENKKIFVLLHSWELGIFIFILYLLEKDFILNKLYFFSSLSYLTHLMIDQYTNKPRYLGYSILFRFLNKFEIKSFCS